MLKAWNEAREAKILSFFSRVDLLNRTDPGEAVRNVESRINIDYCLPHVSQ